MRVKKQSIHELFIIVLLLILIFQNLLIEVNPFFGTIDELCAIYLFCVFLVSTFIGKQKIEKDDLIILLLIIVLTIGGLVFNKKSVFEIEKMAIIEDIISMFKFAFLYLGMNAVKKRKAKQKPK